MKHNIKSKTEPTLAENEAIIERGLEAYREAGLALKRIQKGRQYKPPYKTFEAYCKDRWQMSRDFAYKLIRAAENVDKLSTDGPIPATESVARELKGTPEQKRVVWNEAVKRHGNKPTAEQVRNVAEENKVVDIKSKRQQKRQQPKPNPDWDKEGQSIAYDPRVIAWVWDRLDDGWKRDQIVAASKHKTDGWPLDDDALSNGSEGECRAAVVHLKRVGMRPAPHNSRRRGPKRIGEISKALKSASGNYNDLLKMQLQMVKMTDILECYSVEDLDIDTGDEATIWTLEDLLKDLTNHALWIDRTMSSIVARAKDSSLLETIKKLERRAKDPSSEPYERESAARLAEVYKRKRENRLSA